MARLTGPWFAWRPVWLDDGRWVWMRTIWRSLPREYAPIYYYELAQFVGWGEPV